MRRSLLPFLLGANFPFNMASMLAMMAWHPPFIDLGDRPLRKMNALNFNAGGQVVIARPKRTGYTTDNPFGTCRCPTSVF